MSYTPPIDQAELYVASAAMQQPSLTTDLGLEARHFVSIRCAQTWQVIYELRDKSVIDLPTFETAGKKIHGSAWNAENEFVESLQYYGKIEFGNVHQHAAQVLDEYHRRELLRDTTRLLDQANRANLPLGDIRSQLADLAARAGGGMRNWATVGDVFFEVVADLEKDNPSIETVTTGIKKLDAILGGGFRVGVVNVVAARPANGKSTLVMQTAFECAAAKIGVHVFCLEDERKIMVQRAVARAADVPAWQITTGVLDREPDSNGVTKAKKISGMSDKFTALPFALTDAQMGALSVVDVIAITRAAKREISTRVCIIDYLGMLRYDGKMRDRHLQVGEQVQALVDFAARDRIAVVLVVQLNRNFASRSDPRPQLTDLKESGSIEEKGKVVLALHRGYAMGLKAQKGIDYGEHEQAPNAAEWSRMAQAIVLKNSLGVVGPVNLTFDGEKATIV